MFKRIEKRIRKKEEEEELGLDGDMKEMLGMNDTDSDESSSSGSEDESDDEVKVARADGSDAGSDDEDEDAVGDEDDGMDEEEEAESELGSEEEDEDEVPSMTVTEVIRNPIYLISAEPEVKACFVCPGKLLKNPIMIDVHMKSGAHNRHFKRFRDAAVTVEADFDARTLLRAQAHDAKKPAEGQLSKRAQKRKAKQAAIKAKREKQKILLPTPTSRQSPKPPTRNQRRVHRRRSGNSSEKRRRRRTGRMLHRNMARRNQNQHRRSLPRRTPPRANRRKIGQLPDYPPQSLLPRSTQRRTVKGTHRRRRGGAAKPHSIPR
ncbi:hypothetical protein OH76DRAFT_43878 [Lentinus brumalis]|uniref:Uncharacterized protein n=1 Tax=Lentinus brumalis TaxID=2498619 RepID=A0A371DY58_9APHY|nr:hypothetical protein OH76DRAFT_43878 [Polyporus brumalis]